MEEKVPNQVLYKSKLTMILQHLVLPAAAVAVVVVALPAAHHQEAQVAVVGVVPPHHLLLLQIPIQDSNNYLQHLKMNLLKLLLSLIKLTKWMSLIKLWIYLRRLTLNYY